MAATSEVCNHGHDLDEIYKIESIVLNSYIFVIIHQGNKACASESSLPLREDGRGTTGLKTSVRPSPLRSLHRALSHSEPAPGPGLPVAATMVSQPSTRLMGILQHCLSTVIFFHVIFKLN